MKRRIILGAAILLVIAAAIVVRLPARKPPVVGECTITISCENILNNMDDLNQEKAPHVPREGFILKEQKTNLYKGETAYKMLTRVCEENVCEDSCKYCKIDGINMDADTSGGFGNYYVTGIHQLYEKDCGDKSGWMFMVNGGIPQVSASDYDLQPGDEIVWFYTCNAGTDAPGAAE